MWCLAWLLPLMIGDQVSSDDEHWKNFLLLLTILDYIFSPVVSSDCAGHLKELIAEHQCFKELYPTCTIIPKMHYMIHYPECITKYVIICTIIITNNNVLHIIDLAPLFASGVCGSKENTIISRTWLTG